MPAPSEPTLTCRHGKAKAITTFTLDTENISGLGLYHGGLREERRMASTQELSQHMASPCR